MSKDTHSFHQTDLSVEVQVLNISVNMARIGNWISSLDEILKDKGQEVYQNRLILISKMIEQTESYLKDLNSQTISDRFKATLTKFREDFSKMKDQNIISLNYPYWTEKCLTWANILQHRAKLA